MNPVPKPTKESRERARKNRERMKNYDVQCYVSAQKKMGTMWKWYSLLRRLSSCLDSSGGWGFCCTCGKYIKYSDGDAGHYVRQKNHKATVYVDKNVHLQCKHCNMHLNGNEDEYAKFIDSKYGVGTSEWLIEEGDKPYKQPSLVEVESKIAEYRQKAKDESFRVGVELR